MVELKSHSFILHILMSMQVSCEEMHNEPLYGGETGFRKKVHRKSSDSSRVSANNKLASFHGFG